MNEDEENDLQRIKREKYEMRSIDKSRKKKKEWSEARDEKSAVDIWREFVGEIDHIHPLRKNNCTLWKHFGCGVIAGMIQMFVMIRVHMFCCNSEGRVRKGADTCGLGRMQHCNFGVNIPARKVSEDNKQSERRN